MRVAKRMLRYAKPYRRAALMAVLLLTMLTCLGMINPLLSRMLIDRVFGGGERELLPYIIAGLLLVAALRSICWYGKGYLVEKVGQGVIHDLRIDLYDHLQQLSFSYYDRARTGELMSRLTGDVEAVRIVFSDGLLNFYDSILTFVIVAVILWRMNASLTLVSLALTPFLAWAVIRFDQKIRPAYSRIRQQSAHMSAVLQENVTGVRVVKAFAQEDYEIEKFRQENRNLWERNVAAADISAFYFPIMDLLGGMSSVFVLWYGGYHVVQGNLSLGSLVAFNSYIWSLLWPVRNLGNLVNLLEQSMAAGERLVEILSIRPSITSPPDAVQQPMQGKVELRQVALHYGSAYALQDINLLVEPGTTVAIVGATGSGKTSLVNLLPRFYDVSEGQVLIDDIDVRQWDLSVLRRSIGIALQETFLFSMSLHDNIAFGRQEASRAEVERAARLAQAHDFISSLPDGYDTLVGERGVGLSGGQRQRVAIARALLVDPRILILDDATAAVDMETEYLIQKALQEVMEGVRLSLSPIVWRLSKMLILFWCWTMVAS